MLQQKQNAKAAIKAALCLLKRGEEEGEWKKKKEHEK